MITMYHLLPFLGVYEDVWANLLRMEEFLNQLVTIGKIRSKVTS